MAATNANVAKLSLKVMVHRGQNKVLFAEADSNFVDTLFSIMTMPMATIIRLLEKSPDDQLNSLGSLRNLYRSLAALPAACFSSEECKFMMLNLRTSAYDYFRKLKLNIDDTEPISYFICDHCFHRRGHSPCYSICSLARCSFCGNEMVPVKLDTENSSAPNVGNCSVDDGAFVPNQTTFIVTDDFCVMPNTVGCTLKLLRDFGVTRASQLEERTIYIGHKQFIILLKLSFTFPWPLTYLFFHNSHLVQGGVNPSPRTSEHPLTGDNIGINSSSFKLRVTLQRSTSRFLFAETDGDFADFIFGFLEIPLGTVIGKLLNGISSLVCLDNLFASFSNMSAAGYMKSQDVKDMLIQPELLWKYLSQNQIFPLNASNGSRILFDSYVCPGEKPVRMVGLSGCLCFVSNSLKDPRLQGSFLKAPANFMLTYDLVLTPLPSSSAIAVMNTLNIPLHDVEEYEVSIGMEEGLKILKASLISLSTLTDALLQGNNLKKVI